MELESDSKYNYIWPNYSTDLVSSLTNLAVDLLSVCGCMGCTTVYRCEFLCVHVHVEASGQLQVVVLSTAHNLIFETGCLPDLGLAK